MVKENDVVRGKDAVFERLRRKRTLENTKTWSMWQHWKERGAAPGKGERFFARSRGLSFGGFPFSGMDFVSRDSSEGSRVNVFGPVLKSGLLNGRKLRVRGVFLTYKVNCAGGLFLLVLLLDYACGVLPVSCLFDVLVLCNCSRIG